MINIPNKNKTYRLVYDKDGELTSARLFWKNEYGEERTANFSNGMATINNYGRYKVAHFDDGELCKLEFKKCQNPLDIDSITECMGINEGYSIAYRTTGKNSRFRYDTISTSDFQTMCPTTRLVTVPIEYPKFTME